VFPLTRQSFVLSTVILVLTFSGWTGSARLIAQDEDKDKETLPPAVAPAGAAPAGAAPAAAAWTPPSWYMDEVEAKKFGREKIRIIQFLKLNRLNSAQTAQVNRIAHYYLSLMLHEGNRQRLPKDVTQRMLADILTPSNRAPSRAVLMNEVIDKIPALLNHPSDVVRVNAVLLLSGLSIEPANFQKKIPAVPFTPVYKILITILTDEKQLTACKIAAVRGLGRVCRDDATNALSSNARSDIAKALVGTLAATPASTRDGVRWLRFRIVDTLGYVNRLDQVGGQPIVIDTLIQILGNPKEHLKIRSQAALSISRLPYASSTNVQLITHEVCELLLRLISELEDNPKGTHWRDYFSRVYLAFRPATQAQANKNWGLLYQVKRGGLGANKKFVDDAFERAMPIIKLVLEFEDPASIPKEDLKTLTDWVKKNKPTNRKVTPSSKDLP
jgi:hypothetical protein